MSAKKAPDLQALLELSLPRDARMVEELEFPPDSALSGLSTKDLAKVTMRFRKVAKDLFENPAETLGDLAGSGEIERRTFWNLCGPVLSYYGFGLFQCALEDGYAKALGDIITEHDIDLVENPHEEQPEHLFGAWTVVAMLDIMATELFTAARVDGLGLLPGEPPERFDSDLSVADSLLGFRQMAMKGSTERVAVSTLLLDNALAYRREVLRQRYEMHRSRAEDGLAGVTKRELVWLASRNNLMTEKYGAKKVERVFEQKLALLFQALGFTVIPAKPGEAEADLLCISRQDRFSFLVDAKSSKAAYALPKTDQRALAEYSRGFSSKLPDLPPLGFILIVGHGPAKTVPAKMKTLESRTEVPVRFIRASVLGGFSEGIPGPVSAAVFRDKVLASDHLVGASIVDEVREAFDSVVSAYTDFVERLRGASSI